MGRTGGNVRWRGTSGIIEECAWQCKCDNVASPGDASCETRPSDRC